MSKPSDELMRRAREFCKGKPVGDDVITPTQLVISPFMAQFAEQIVRECSEIARDKATYANTGTFTVENRVMLLRETADEVLHKFGLKE